MSFKSLLLIICVIILAACGEQNIPTSTTQANQRTANLNQEEIVEFIGAPFPSSARNIFTIGDSALDTIVAARFDSARSDVSDYLKTIGITTMMRPSYSPFISNNAPILEATDWWDVVAYGEGSNLSYAGVNEFINGKNYSILVINPDAEIATIYITVHNT